MDPYKTIKEAALGSSSESHIANDVLSEQEIEKWCNKNY